MYEVLCKQVQCTEPEPGTYTLSWSFSHTSHQSQPRILHPPSPYVHTYDQYIRQWGMKDSQLGPMAHVAAALQKSVDPGFGLGRWSFFSCRLPLSSVSTEAMQSFIANWSKCESYSWSTIHKWLLQHSVFSTNMHAVVFQHGRHEKMSSYHITCKISRKKLFPGKLTHIPHKLWNANDKLRVLSTPDASPKPSILLIIPPNWYV